MRFTTFNFEIGLRSTAFALTRRSTALLLLFGLPLLLIHLGDTRVLTRHEVLAAQPGREMLHDGSLRRWMLPMLGGLPREAKPPGMMWLIAASIYVFRSEAEWVARLPSVLAAMFIALSIARLTARWFGDRMGRLAGLLQLTFVYTLMQAKLSEADMSLAAAVCAALCALAAGVIDSPEGRVNGRRSRVIFWLAIGCSFLLKGPIGPLFVAMTAVCFAFVQRNARVLHFVLDPIGIVSCLILVTVWPLAAWRIDPSILSVWHSELIGSAAGRLGRDPIYYYLWSVPVMLLPWTPLVLIGLRRGPNAELSGAVVSQTDRAMLWKFLFCWFIPGILFLTLGMKMKHHHYSIPIMIPLTIPAAIGLDYYVRRQTSRAQGLLWPVFLAGCALAALIVWQMPLLLPALKLPIIRLIILLAAGGLIALRYERLRRPGLVITTYFLTTLAIAVGVQTWLMPVQDDFKYQADFAIYVNGSVPPGVTVYMLGHREEEQEAEYAYYLRFPMQRLRSPAELPRSDAPVYAIAPAGLLPELHGSGDVQTLVTCSGLRSRETEADRLCLLRITP